jgi:hypothetical protein
MPTLSARVNVRANRGDGPNKPRFSKLSDITIVAAIRSTVKGKGDTFVPVATRTIPGAWDSKAALAEFKKNPTKFTYEAGYNANIAKLAA